MNTNSVRYSDSELEEFKAIIEKKLARSKEQLELLESQIYEVAENGDSDYGQDMMDDSNTNSDIEMLNNLAIHQRKYIRELENALSRIRHKSYGICEITGRLIDRKRLMAVPTTTKSLAAKLGKTAPVVTVDSDHEGEEDQEDLPKKKKAPQRQVITKVIRKLPAKKAVEFVEDLEDEEEEEEFRPDDANYEEEEEREIPFQNMDDFSAEDSEF